MGNGTNMNGRPSDTQLHHGAPMIVREWKKNTGECGSIRRSPSLDVNNQKSRDHVIPFREVNSKRPNSYPRRRRPVSATRQAPGHKLSNFIP